jgi:hypothetical protein
VVRRALQEGKLLEARMDSRLRYEDRLDGASNFVQWKYRMKNALQDNKALEQNHGSQRKASSYKDVQG